MNTATNPVARLPRTLPAFDGGSKSVLVKARLRVTSPLTGEFKDTGYGLLDQMAAAADCWAAAGFEVDAVGCYTDVN